MAATAILALDQGTTNTKAVLVSADGAVLAERSRSVPVHYPQSGWAEQSADDIWETVQTVLADILDDADGWDIVGLGISNQRETIVLWDKQSGRPVAPAILWQCRRTSQLCTEFRDRGAQPLVFERTGLVLDPLFPSTKIKWLLDSDEDLRSRAEKGELLAGTVDSWLVWKLTGGAVHATDHSNASRTQLLDLDRLIWDPDLLALFAVPPQLLAEVRSSDDSFGCVASGVTALPGGLPIRGVLGDSHAALFGQGVREPGHAKVTCGTGSSMMALTARRLTSGRGLSSTIAWSRQGRVAYAIEGNISVSGRAAAFAAQLLGLPDEQALTELAQSVASSDGVYFVPALAGLGAPHWDDHARGLICGMTLRTNPGHLARAVMEAIAFQICDVFDAMEADLGSELVRLSADGGASRNDYLMQLLADVLGRPVLRPAVTEASALGAARMAAEALGMWSGQAASERLFSPMMDEERRSELRNGWRDAVTRARLPASGKA